MDIFDSNVWIWGLTYECDLAEGLIEDVVHEERWVAVSPYIFEEVVQNLARSEHQQKTIERAQTRFGEIVHGSSHVDAPSMDAVRQCDLDEVRSMHPYSTIASTTGIQVKDAPILSYAHSWADLPDTRRPGGDVVTIYTADRSFARFDAEEYYENLQMQYVPC